MRVGLARMLQIARLFRVRYSQNAKDAKAGPSPLVTNWTRRVEHGPIGSGAAVMEHERNGRRRKDDKVTTDHLSYRPAVGIMLLNREGLVWVGRRKSDAGPEHVDDTYAWQMPQGGIDEGEDPYVAALRELHEETNVRSVSLIAEAPDWYAYDLPTEVIRKSWKGRYRGQRQKWFALRFLGDEHEIDVAAPAGHKPEFSDWRWAPMQTLPDLIIPFKRPVYEQVVAAFLPYAGTRP